LIELRNREITGNPAHRVIVAALLLYLILTGVWLGRYPAVWIDEGWVAAPGYAVAQGLPMGSPTLGEAFRFADRYYWNSPLFPLALSVPFHLGAPPLETGRLLSLIAGAVTLALLLCWLRAAAPRGGAGGNPAQNGISAAALVAVALLFTLDTMLWKSHRTVRFEAWTGMWTVAALFSAWGVRSPFLRGAAAGGFSALALLGHPNGVFAAAAAGLLLCRRDSARLRSLAWAVGIGALCLVPWAWYLWGDHASGFANLRGQNLPHLQGGARETFPAWALLELRRYAAYFGLPRLAVPLGLWAVTVAWGLWRRRDRGFLLPAVTLAAGLVLVPNKSELYLTLVAPLVYLGVGRLWHVSPYYRILVAAALLNFAAADAALLWRNRNCDYDAWVSRIRDAVPAGTPAAGTFVTWFPFRDDPYLEFVHHRAGDVADRRPPYLIWDRRTLDDPGYDRLRREMEPILEKHADPVAESDSRCYGRATVYHMRWDELSPAQAATLEHWAEPDSADPGP